MKNIFYILFISLLASSCIYAQTSSFKKENSFDKIQLNSQSEKRLNYSKSMQNDTTTHLLRSLVVSKNYSKNHYGVFCKLENRIHKNTKFPVRFRLGTLDYVNKLEGKQ